MEEVLAIILIFGGGAAVAMSFSPLGRALADRIRGRVAGPDPEVIAELDQLRQEMLDVQERLDFAERLMAQQREAGRLEPGGE